MAESLTRTAAFLIEFEKIGPFECQPLRFRHWLILALDNHPLLSKRIPTPVQLSTFLWLISPSYSQSAPFSRQCFLRRCRATFCPPGPPLLKSSHSEKWWLGETARKLKVAADLIDTARAYVDEALMDLPKAGETAKYTRSYYSDAASVIGRMAREFPGMFTEREVLEMPMKKLLQYLNESKRKDDPTAPLHNPSDDISNAWVAQRNKVRRMQQGKN